MLFNVSLGICVLLAMQCISTTVKVMSCLWGPILCEKNHFFILFLLYIFEKNWQDQADQSLQTAIYIFVQPSCSLTNKIVAFNFLFLS